MCSRIGGGAMRSWAEMRERIWDKNWWQFGSSGNIELGRYRKKWNVEEWKSYCRDTRKKGKHMFRQKSQKWKKGLESEIRLEITVRSVDVWRKTKTKTKTKTNRDFVGGGRKVGRGDGILRGTKSRRDLAVISLRPPCLMSHHNLFLLLCLQLVRITFLITRGSRW